MDKKYFSDSSCSGLVDGIAGRHVCFFVLCRFLQLMISRYHSWICTALQHDWTNNYLKSVADSSILAVSEEKSAEPLHKLQLCLKCELLYSADILAERYVNIIEKT